MATYSEIKWGLDQIAAKNAHNRDILVNARASLVTARDSLNAMQGNYSTLVADINQAAIDNPSDVAYQTAKSEKDKLVADFLALKTWADDLITAYDAA